MCRALGRPDLLADPRFADAGAIRRHRTEVIAILDEIVAGQSLDVWAERFDREGVWWAPAQGAGGRARGSAAGGERRLPPGADGAGGETRRSVNGPVSFSDLPLRPAPPAPGLGQHTDEVFAELGRRRP